MPLYPVNPLLARRLQNIYDETEQVSRCRLCGYMVTDQEKAFYGDLFFDSKGDLKQAHYFCEFCWDGREFNFHPVSPWTMIKWLVFNRVDLSIYKTKKEMKALVFESRVVVRLEQRIKYLENDHADQVNPHVYSEEKNLFQIEIESLREQVSDFKNEARIAYLSSVGRFGDHRSDEAPATRKLNPRQKKLLDKLLKDELNRLTLRRRMGYFD